MSRFGVFIGEGKKGHGGCLKKGLERASRLSKRNLELGTHEVAEEKERSLGGVSCRGKKTGGHIAHKEKGEWGNSGAKFKRPVS